MLRIVSLTRILPIVALLLAAAQSVHAADITGVPHVVSGGAVNIGKARLRLAGIAAPALEQLCVDASGGRWTPRATNSPNTPKPNPGPARAHASSGSAAPSPNARSMARTSRNGWSDRAGPSPRRARTIMTPTKPTRRLRSQGFGLAHSLRPPTGAGATSRPPCSEASTSIPHRAPSCCAAAPPPSHRRRNAPSRVTSTGPAPASITCRAAAGTRGSTWSRTTATAGSVRRKRRSLPAAARPSGRSPRSPHEAKPRCGARVELPGCRWRSPGLRVQQLPVIADPRPNSGSPDQSNPAHRPDARSTDRLRPGLNRIRH